MKRNIDNTYYVYSELGDTDDVTDIINSNDLINKRNICNDEFIKMLSSGNIYEHTKEPYDDKYDIEVIRGQADIDESERFFIPVTINVYRKGEKTAYSLSENIYPITVFDDGKKLGLELTDDKYKMIDIYPENNSSGIIYSTMLYPVDMLLTDNLTTMKRMFYNCKVMKNVKTHNFNTSKVTNMSEMFSDCNSLTTLDVSNFNTINVTDMSDMFRNCWSLTTLDVSNFNTSNVTNMNGMFDYCNKLTTLDVSKWDTSNVTNMSDIFYYCKSLTILDVSNFNTSNVTNMSFMFRECSSLTTLDVSNWDTSNVTDMSGMFNNCINLTTITGVIDMKSCTNYNNMFSDCAKLTGVKLKNVPSGFDASKAGLKAGQYTIVS